CQLDILRNRYMFMANEGGERFGNAESFSTRTHPPMTMTKNFLKTWFPLFSCAPSIYIFPYK
ncbi:MAG: hypothetical protein QXW41_09280, partial [Fervidicoccaceae archaeon]